MANVFDKFDEKNVFDQFDEVKETGVTDQAIGALETISTIASSIPATIGGGVTGAVTTALTGDPDAGEAVRAGVTEALTYEGGEQSQEQLESLGEGFEQIKESVIDPALAGTAGIVDVALNPYTNITQGFEPAKETVRAIKEQGLPEAAGREALEKTGSPLFATIIETFASTAPDIAGSIGALSKISKPSFKFFKRKNPATERIANKIKSGTTDKDFVKKMVDGSGRVLNDKVAIESIRQGFDEGVIAAVKGSTKADKRVMSRMVNTLERGRKNALYAAKNRPADAAGDSLLKQVSFVKKNNSDAGKQLDRVANRLKGKETNIDGAVESFISKAEDMGVTFSENLVPDFTGSTIETINPAKKLIKDIALKIRRNPNPDAHQAHKLKKFIDENVSFGKRAKGLSGEAESIAKGFRKDINDTLADQFIDYAEANERYSDTISILDDIQDASGSKVNLFGPNSEKALGTVLRRLMSNTQSRVNLLDAVNNIKKVSKKYGGAFDDDILTQMLFADELDSMFGAPARTSFQGEIQKAVSRKPFTERAIDYAGEKLEKARGINEDAAIKNIKQLLKQGE